MTGFRQRITRRSGSDLPANLIDRIFALRGVKNPEELDLSIKGLLPPESLSQVYKAAQLVTESIQNNRRILIVGDFDADGATSCALMVRVLRALGADHVDYLVPDRFKFGYGLTPEIVDVAVERNPDLLITVDNGIASIEGVARANSLGIQVLITDHHLPGNHLPDAAAIVNPNQHGCEFGSKHLAGVGVAFYLLSMVRSQLRSQGWFDQRDMINLAHYLDLVALGTIADVVVLDQNNRRLVNAGIARLRAGAGCPGIHALLNVSGIDQQFVTSRDLAFSVAPRLNAAGRLQDISIGIECLLAEGDRATELAEHLDQLNAERKEIETDMRDAALAELDELRLESEQAAGICLYHENWHEGVVGIVASRVKEKSHRPVIAFARAGAGELKGSGRSVQGFHMRDALDAIATKNPGLIVRFGGHAMAAGLSLDEAKFDAFSVAFDAEVQRVLGVGDIEQVIESDGELGEAITIQLARALESAAPWGQGFPEPVFDDDFEILEQRIVGGRHLKLLLQPTEGKPVDAICFNQGGLAEKRYVRCAYRIEINRYRGLERPQLVVGAIL